MNQKDQFIRENNTKRLLMYSDRMHRNCIRLNCGSTWEHELMKVRKCWELLNAGHDFITEARFEKGGRADVLDLTEGIAYEVVVSESEASILEKSRKYPVPVRVIKP